MPNTAQRLRPGLMTSGLLETWQGKPLDLDGYLALLRSWGLQTLDVFQPFVDAVGAETLRQHANAHGLEIACFYVQADLITAEPATAVAELDKFPRAAETALTLGSPLLFTHGSQHAYSGADNLQRYKRRLAEALDALADAPVTLIIENAGALMHSADQMLEVYEAVASPKLKLAADTGNFYLWSQDEVEAVRRILPHTVHFHIKDYGRRWLENDTPRARATLLGAGSVRHEEILQLIRASEYSGTLAFERAGQDDPTFEASVRRTVQWCAADAP